MWICYYGKSKLLTLVWGKIPKDGGGGYNKNKLQYFPQILEKKLIEPILNSVLLTG